MNRSLTEGIASCIYIRWVASGYGLHRGDGLEAAVKEVVRLEILRLLMF
jgi:hypothetical protein